MFFLFTGRVGSIIATFEMTVASNLSPTYLTVKSKELAKQLDALLVLETSGKHICYPFSTGQHSHVNPLRLGFCVQWDFAFDACF